MKRALNQPKRRVRMVVENTLTLGIWSVWSWSACQAADDWNIMVIRKPSLPTSILISAGACAFLALFLWLRGRKSLVLLKKGQTKILAKGSEQKCLSMLGLDAERLMLARQAKAFDVSTGAEDMNCSIHLEKG